MTQCCTDEDAETKAEDKALLSLLVTEDQPDFKDQQLTHGPVGERLMSTIQEQLA